MSKYLNRVIRDGAVHEYPNSESGVWGLAHQILEDVGFSSVSALTEDGEMFYVERIKEEPEQLDLEIVSNYVLPDGRRMIVAFVE